MLIIQVNCINYIVTCQFLPERMKIDKTQKLVCNLRDKKKYVAHISILKKSIKSWVKIKESAQSDRI